MKHLAAFCIIALTGCSSGEWAESQHFGTLGWLSSESFVWTLLWFGPVGLAVAVVGFFLAGLVKG